MVVMAPAPSRSTRESWVSRPLHTCPPRSRGRRGSFEGCLVLVFGLPRSRSLGRTARVTWPRGHSGPKCRLCLREGRDRYRASVHFSRIRKCGSGKRMGVWRCGKHGYLWPGEADDRGFRFWELPSMSRTPPWFYRAIKRSKRGRRKRREV